MNKKNIIVGAARVFIYNEPLIDNDGAPALTTHRATTGSQAAHLEGIAGWRDVGYTQDGLEIATDPSYGEVEVDQLLDAAKIFKDGMGLSISTTFAEATLENLLVAWGQNPSTLSSTATEKELEIDGGALGEAPVERGLAAIGNAVEKAGENTYGERTYFAYRVLSVDAATTSMSRAEAATIPVTFRALPASDGKYGVVRDRMDV